MLYYLSPFAIAFAILGVREILLNLHGEREKIELAPVTQVATPILSPVESDKPGGDRP